MKIAGVFDGMEAEVIRGSPRNREVHMSVRNLGEEFSPWKILAAAARSSTD